MSGGLWWICVESGGIWRIGWRGRMEGWRSLGGHQVQIAFGNGFTRLGAFE